MLPRILPSPSVGSPGRSFWVKNSSCGICTDLGLDFQVAIYKLCDSSWESLTLSMPQYPLIRQTRVNNGSSLEGAPLDIVRGSESSTSRTLSTRCVIIRLELRWPGWARLCCDEQWPQRHLSWPTTSLSLQSGHPLRQLCSAVKIAEGVWPPPSPPKRRCPSLSLAQQRETWLFTASAQK